MWFRVSCADKGVIVIVIVVMGMRRWGSFGSWACDRDEVSFAAPESFMSLLTFSIAVVGVGGITVVHSLFEHGD